MNNYVIRKRNYAGSFIIVKELPNTSEAIAKSVAAVLSCQKAHEGEFVFLVDDEHQHTIVYFDGRKCREFKENKMIFTLEFLHE